MRPFAVSTAATRWYYKCVDDSDAIISHIQWQSSKDAFRQLNLSPTKNDGLYQTIFFWYQRPWKNPKAPFLHRRVLYCAVCFVQITCSLPVPVNIPVIKIRVKKINWVYMSFCIDLIGCGPTKALLLCYSWQLRIWSWVGTFAAPNSLICSTSSELELTGVSWAHNVGV